MEQRAIHFPEERNIETPRLLLRPLREADLEAYFAICSDPEVMRTWGTKPHASLEDTRQLLAFLDESYRLGLSARWGVEEKATGRLVGDVGFWRFVKERFRAEVGAKLARDCWSRGYMTEALVAVVGFGLEAMGLHSVEANVDPGNPGAIRLVEKAGFEREGLLREHSYDWETGRFVDTALFSAVRTRWRRP